MGLKEIGKLGQYLSDGQLEMQSSKPPGTDLNIQSSGSSPLEGTRMRGEGRDERKNEPWGKGKAFLGSGVHTLPTGIPNTIDFLIGLSNIISFFHDTLITSSRLEPA